MNLLIIDNEKVVLRTLKKQLSKIARKIETIDTYEEAKDHILSKNFDVVLLDHQLSIDDSSKQGLDLLKEVRSQRNKTPIILLTARDIEEINSWDTLDSGADDFIKKPYLIDDLIARIKLAYRKSFHCNFNSSSVLIYDDIELNIETRKVRVKGKESVLAEKDTLLLSKFLKYPHKLFSAEDLIRYLWIDADVYNKKNMNALRVNVCSLKSVLRDEKYIHNRYGYGYIFDETQEYMS